MNDLYMLHTRVDQCRETYQAWMDALAARAPDRIIYLTAYDAAKVALGKEWRAIGEVLREVAE